MKKVIWLLVFVIMVLGLIGCTDVVGKNGNVDLPEFTYLSLVNYGSRVYINSYKIDGSIIYVDGYTLTNDNNHMNDEGEFIIDEEHYTKRPLYIMTDISNVFLFKEGEAVILPKEEGEARP